MFRALYTAASGMTAQQLNLDNIANNLANSSTTGFQQRQVNFTDLLYQNEIMPGAAATQQTTVAAGWPKKRRSPATPRGNTHTHDAFPSPPSPAHLSTPAHAA